MPEQFRFNIDRVRSHHSKAEIVASLKEYGELHGQPTFGMREYDKWPKRLVSAETIRVQFGSWGNALRAAGFRAERGRKLDPKKMVAAFKDCWREQQSVPSGKQLEDYLARHNLPFRCKSYLNFFGGLGRLAQMIVKVEEGKITEAMLYQKIKPNRKVDRTVSLKMRMSVLKRDGYRCVKCGASPKTDKSVALEVDHIVPVSKGGTSVLDNLQTLCFNCNQGKTDQDD